MTLIRLQIRCPRLVQGTSPFQGSQFFGGKCPTPHYVKKMYQFSVKHFCAFLLNLQHWPRVRDGCRRIGACFRADLGGASSNSLVVWSVVTEEPASFSLPGSSTWTVRAAPSSSEGCNPLSDEEFSLNKQTRCRMMNFRRILAVHHIGQTLYDSFAAKNSTSIITASWVLLHCRFITWSPRKVLWWDYLLNEGLTETLPQSVGSFFLQVSRLDLKVRNTSVWICMMYWTDILIIEWLGISYRAL